MILNSQPIVIFLGKSGAGKDTQMELLREKMGFDFINSGELLRERKKIQDFTGKILYFLPFS